MKNPRNDEIPYRIDVKAATRLRFQAAAADVISAFGSTVTAIFIWLFFRLQFRKYGVKYRIIRTKEPAKSIFLFALEWIPIASIYWGVSKRVEATIQESREEDEKNYQEQMKRRDPRRRFDSRYKRADDREAIQEANPRRVDFERSRGIPRT